MKSRKSTMILVAVLSALCGCFLVARSYRTDELHRLPALPQELPVQNQGTVTLSNPANTANHSSMNSLGAASTPEKPKPILELWREQVFEDHPDIGQFAQLSRRVLKSTEDKRSFQALLSDQGIITQSKSDLLDSSREYSDIEQRKRMYRVEYLGAAIQWKDNPQRAVAIEAIEDVIFARNIKSDSSPEQKQSLAGDKIELYWSLLEHDPAQAEAVANKAKGTEFENIVDYAQRKWDAVMNAKGEGG